MTKPLSLPNDNVAAVWSRTLLKKLAGRFFTPEFFIKAARPISRLRKFR
ncbi:hypothetical protein HLI03_19075 [Rhizobium laguerreae]|nr:hypothetical protein [Rhizobium laguerreae]NNH43734.1 hypothetical protein [Rhizobium laguerreae]